MPRRILSIWFPRLASDRALRARPVAGPFALTLHERSTERLYCLNEAAEAAGLTAGMGFADARALCPDLTTQPADPPGDARFLHLLARWAGRYAPWVGLEEPWGLVLDITGTPHLFGGEAGLAGDLSARLERAGITARIGLAGSRGAAWARAHYAPGIVAPGQEKTALESLPVAALRLDPRVVAALQRLGIRTVGDLAGQPRASLTRRFGPGLMLRLDQAFGSHPEEVAPLADPPRFALRLTLPDPIGLKADVMAGLERLLGALCERLLKAEAGARELRLTLSRVDKAAQQVELRLARPMRDAGAILPLFERGVEGVEAGYGIDRLHLEATLTENLPARQIEAVGGKSATGLDDLISKLGTRLGLERITRVLPADSHIPERSFVIAPAAWSEPASGWSGKRKRPLLLFPPEPIPGQGSEPPARFRWRRRSYGVARAFGPERIAPEWWFDDPNWRSGLRDYWRVETGEGARLWLFHTPQSPGWFVQGEFA